MTSLPFTRQSRVVFPELTFGDSPHGRVLRYPGVPPNHERAMHLQTATFPSFPDLHPHHRDYRTNRTCTSERNVMQSAELHELIPHLPYIYKGTHLHLSRKKSWKIHGKIRQTIPPKITSKCHQNGIEMPWNAVKTQQK